MRPAATSARLAFASLVALVSSACRGLDGTVDDGVYTAASRRWSAELPVTWIVDGGARYLCELHDGTEAQGGATLEYLDVLDGFGGLLFSVGAVAGHAAAHAAEPGVDDLASMRERMGSRASELEVVHREDAANVGEGPVSFEVLRDRSSGEDRLHVHFYMDFLDRCDMELLVCAQRIGAGHSSNLPEAMDFDLTARWPRIREFLEGLHVSRPPGAPAPDPGVREAP